MKQLLIILSLLLYSFSAFGQEEQKGAFVSDSTWLKEIIKFPIDFAPNISYKGYEDLKFAKNWRNKDHNDFWCYTFVWHINSNEKQTAKILETHIKLYYDGLMGVVNKKKDYKVPETTVLFIKNEKNNTNTDNFIGKLHVYDSFNTEAMMLLNARVKVLYCDITKTSAIVFRLSPQDFNHEIWERFKTIKLRDDICEF
ncbi:hypothetical protein A9Q86_11805 [Flavobacteriales bacterium 33_180_T64]|nr:hypothetical protein A9Q86_11805 [Flavobacteriales bacterium 33_180_T64]